MLNTRISSDLVLLRPEFKDFIITAIACTDVQAAVWPLHDCTQAAVVACQDALLLNDLIIFI